MRLLITGVVLTLLVIVIASVLWLRGGNRSDPALSPTRTAAPFSQVSPTSISLPSLTSTSEPPPIPTISLRDLVPPELIATTPPYPIATIQPPFSLPSGISTPVPTDTPPAEVRVFTITSDAFRYGDPIPQTFTCDGADESPPLMWSGVPDGTRALALIFDDLDAPVGVFTHWVVYNLPPESGDLPLAVPNAERIDNGAIQGRNDFREDNIGYKGPCPLRGNAHRYRFYLYALDAALDLESGASRQEVIDLMAGHVLDEALLFGTYLRGEG